MTGMHDRRQNQLLKALQVAEYDFVCSSVQTLVGKRGIIPGCIAIGAVLF